MGRYLPSSRELAYPETKKLEGLEGFTVKHILRRYLNLRHCELPWASAVIIAFSSSYEKRDHSKYYFEHSELNIGELQGLCKILKKNNFQNFGRRSKGLLPAGWTNNFSQVAFEPFANPRLQKYCWIFDNWKVTLGQAWSVGFVAARSQRDQNTKLRICSSLRAELGGQVMRGDIACDQKPEGPEWGFTVEVTVEDIPILLNQMQCELTWAGANTATSTYGLLFLRVPVSSAWARVWHSYAKNLISMKSEDSLFANSYCIKKTSVKVLQWYSEGDGFFFFF